MTTLHDAGQPASSRSTAPCAEGAPEIANSVGTTANQASDAYVEALAQSIEAAPVLALFAREFEAAHPESPQAAMAIALADDIRCLGDAQSAPSTMSTRTLERTLYRLASRAEAIAELCRRGVDR